MPNAEIDQRILACCDARFLKVARIISEVRKGSALDDKEWAVRAITKRIRVLWRKRQIEAVGNIWNPRGSEIRLAVRAS